MLSKFTRRKLVHGRDFFEAPTTNLDQLECHVTTLNPGEAPHAPHQHPEEELIIVKEGTIEAMQNGVTKRAGPGSMIFEASNDLHGLRNVGQTPASCTSIIKYYPPGNAEAEELDREPGRLGHYESAKEFKRPKTRTATRRRTGDRAQVNLGPGNNIVARDGHVRTAKS